MNAQVVLMPANANRCPWLLVWRQWFHDSHLVRDPSPGHASIWARKEKPREPHGENHEEDEEGEELAPVANGDALRDPYAMVISQAVPAPAAKERGQGQHAWEGVCGSTISHAQRHFTSLVLCMSPP